MLPSNPSGKSLLLEAYVLQCTPASKVVCMCSPFLGYFKTAIFYGLPQVRLKGVACTVLVDEPKPKPRTERGKKS